MIDGGVVVALGFVLGMRHATDADHVVAVATMVTRQRDLLTAALTGLLWGVGHSLTVIAVGTAIILFNVSIPARLGIGMELSVCVMLVVLGLSNMAACLGVGPSGSGRSHLHGPLPDAHLRAADDAQEGSLDRRFGRWRPYALARPVVIGVVHGLAGSAGVALLIAAAVREPSLAVVYLVVFGVGTIAGMMIVTVSIASAVRLAGDRSDTMSRRFGFAAGLVSVVLGLAFAHQVWFA